MKYPATISTENVARLALADGSIWDIFPADDWAYDVFSALAKAMQLQIPDKSAQSRSCYSTHRKLIIRVDEQKIDSAQILDRTLLIFEDKNTICAVISNDSHGMRAFQLMHLSLVICRDVQGRSGVLLHGALAEWNGNGVILAGPGGRGKTTASKRLPRHWQSFCDDTTLVVCDKNGVYRAHPWPTWSTFMFNGPGGTWNVQHAVPLKGIFFLEQSHEDAFKPLRIPQSICLLNESAEQVSWSMPGHDEKNVLRKLRLQRFDNICKLAKIIPSYHLRMGPEGTFWQEIERALNDE